MSIRSITTLIAIFVFVGTNISLAAGSGAGSASMQRSFTQFRSNASPQGSAYRYNNQNRYQEQQEQQVREQARQQKRIQDPEAAGDQVVNKDMLGLRTGEHVDDVTVPETVQ